MTTEILVATDGSERAEPVTTRALELAARIEATVHVLYVVDTRRYGEPALSSVEIVIDQCEDEGKQHVQTLIEDGKRRGIDVEGHCRRGDPTDEIVAMAAEVDVDLVVPCLEDVTPTHLRRHGLDREKIGATQRTLSA
ncbi:universal stress protein [Halorhabdus sp. CUG00001]|uniref:universal stress protein n=1 Tax=Halorhabdus sp. CUG00001 TaxID=2600297 RepID=UPI00131C7A9B|nr:universal stress protein [Halorhabdus sp. CUG00001]